MTYGKTMVFDAFFNMPDVPHERIAGWAIKGHNAADEYDEFVVVGRDSEEWCDRIATWKDWIRIPLAIGNPLLERDRL